MKKTLSLLLALCLTASLLCMGLGTAQAAEAENEAVFAARAMGIMTGDENGSMNLTSNVTRAEFAKMMVAASKYKDSVGTGVGVSLYKDVKSDHWASQYIKLAVEEGWFQGYVDGTFRPSGNISLEEGATVLLRALGYSAADLMGAYPSAQLSKYSSLGLGDGVTTAQGQSLTRQNCAQLFYNLMGTKTKAGEYYGATLGYTVTNGKINYSALVNDNMKGPYLAEEGGTGIPISSPSVIKNGKSISQSQIAKYDVYYYNAGMKTVWVYDAKAVGTINSVSPNSAAPEKVTVAGVSYKLSTSEAQFAVSDTGSYRSGDTVTLLLDRNGDAAFVVGAENVSGVFYGVVTSSEKQAVTIDGNATVIYAIKVACTDGVERTVNSTYQKSSVGAVVSVRYQKGEPTISTLSSRTMAGRFSLTSFGDKKLADDVEILDVSGMSSMRIWPERLNGTTLNSSDVLYYELNGNGELWRLILKNATGDCADYAYLTSAVEYTDEHGTFTGAEYRYIINGAEKALTTSYHIGGAKNGGVALNYKNGAVNTFTPLSSYYASEITELQAKGSSATYRMAENAQVYLYKGGSYQTVTVSAVSDSGRYNYNIWVDDGGTAGGRVRILIATEK